MTESPKLTEDGLSLRLEPEELREVESRIEAAEEHFLNGEPQKSPPIGLRQYEEDQVKAENRAILPKRRKPQERSGFVRGECISGKHQVGTKAGCQACESYKASTVVRK